MGKLYTTKFDTIRRRIIFGLIGSREQRLSARPDSIPDSLHLTRAGSLAMGGFRSASVPTVCKDSSVRHLGGDMQP
jgi:hypothetical protein